jgi:gamma-glutamylcyclotransferase (GGCT)/AIG2-like uncharacterized protein YtfP
MKLLYFAYGSNMFEARFKQRVPSAKFFTTATLSGYQLSFAKRSMLDGSGKCTITPSHSIDVVHGVVYKMDASERPLLDEAEGLGKGYDLIDLLLDHDVEAVNAFAYIASSDYVSDSLKPFDWYKAFVVAGAKQHHLPEGYIAEVESIETESDLDEQRAQLHWNILSSS